MVEDHLTTWLTELQQGDERAAQEIWEEYFDRLVRLAKGKLRGVPGRSFDEEDVALSAMNSFIQGAKKGSFPKLDDHSDLWRLLVTITARKAQKHLRQRYAQKRGGGNVRGESVFMKADDHGDGPGIGAVMGDAPTPALAAEFAESCANMIDVLGDQVMQEVARLKLEGHTNAEIADQLGCTERTVERKLNIIREKWTANCV